MNLILFLFVFISSCENRTVKYYGLNDLVVGVHQVVLYENNEFYLELGLGGVDGTYEITDDSIVHLLYDDKPENWPDQLIMTNKYFETITNDGTKSIRIKRGK